MADKQYLDDSGNVVASPPAQKQYLDPNTGEPAKTSAPEAPPEGFWHSLGSQFGITPQAAQAAAQQEKDHPIKSFLWNALGPAGGVAKSLYDTAKTSGGELGQAYQAAKEGNPAGVAQHAITAVPIVGPALAKGAGQYAQGDLAGTAGTIVGATAQAAPAVLAGADAAVPTRPVLKLPSRANAASVFNDLNTKLDQQPIDLKATVAPLQRATEIGVRGGTLPKPISDLLARSQSPIPMTFPEARDYQMALTDLSRSDIESLTPRMKAQVAQVNQALFQDIYNASNQKGLGPDYAAAMKEFRQASQIKDAATTLAKKAIPAAVGGGIAAHYLKELIP